MREITSYVQYFLIGVFFILFTKLNIENKIIIRNRAGVYCCNIFWVIEWGILTFIASYRKVFDIYGGADAQNYIDCFLYGYEYSSEKLFYMFGKIIRLFTDNYHIYFLFVYGIIVAGMLLFVNVFFPDSKCSIPVLFLYFNIYIQSFGVMRQWLAISIGMIAIVLVKKNKKYLGCVVMTLAALVHFTMFALVLTLLAYYIYNFINMNIKLKEDYAIKVTKTKLQIAIFFNICTFFLGTIFISLLGKTEYSAYVDANLLKSVSWIGYMPVIVELIVIFYFEPKYSADEFTKMMIFFLFAHFATIYVMIGLGMFRLFYCFLPFRIWGLCNLKDTIKSRYVISPVNQSIFNCLWGIIVFMDGILYMWRVVGNGALPYFLDI